MVGGGARGRKLPWTGVRDAVDAGAEKRRDGRQGHDGRDGEADKGGPEVGGVEHEADPEGNEGLHRWLTAWR